MIVIVFAERGTKNRKIKVLAEYEQINTKELAKQTIDEMNRDLNKSDYYNPKVKNQWELVVCLSGKMSFDLIYSSKEIFYG